MDSNQLPPFDPQAKGQEYQDDETLFWQNMGVLGYLNTDTSEILPPDEDQHTVLHLAKQIHEQGNLATPVYAKSRLEAPDSSHEVIHTSSSTPQPIVFETEFDSDQEIDTLISSLDDSKAFAVPKRSEVTQHIVFETPPPIETPTNESALDVVDDPTKSMMEEQDTEIISLTDLPLTNTASSFENNTFVIETPDAVKQDTSSPQKNTSDTPLLYISPKNRSVTMPKIDMNEADASFLSWLDFEATFSNVQKTPPKAIVTNSEPTTEVTLQDTVRTPPKAIVTNSEPTTEVTLQDTVSKNHNPVFIPMVAQPRMNPSNSTLGTISNPLEEPSPVKLPHVRQKEPHQFVHQSELPASIKVMPMVFETSNPFEEPDVHPSFLGKSRNWLVHDENTIRLTTFMSILLIIVFSSLGATRFTQEAFVPIDWRQVRMNLLGETQKDDVSNFASDATFVGADYRFPSRDEDWTPLDWERCGCDDCKRNLTKYKADQEKLMMEQKKEEAKKSESDQKAGNTNNFNAGGNLDVLNSQNSSFSSKPTLGTSTPIKPGGNPSL